MKDEFSQVMIELAHAVAAWAAEDRATFVGIISAIHTRYVVSPSLPGIPGPTTEPSKAASQRESAGRLFLYWQKACDKPRAKPVPTRIDPIIRRLREGYTEAEIRKAIDGVAAAPFTSKEGTVYDDLELICRDGTKLEAFIRRGESVTGSIIVDQASSGGVEERITEQRRLMAELKRQGRQVEYNDASAKLTELLRERKDGK
jgi:hypothetical protein